MGQGWVWWAKRVREAMGQQAVTRGQRWRWAPGGPQWEVMAAEHTTQGALMANRGWGGPSEMGGARAPQEARSCRPRPSRRISVGDQVLTQVIQRSHFLDVRRNSGLLLKLLLKQLEDSLALLGCLLPVSLPSSGIHTQAVCGWSTHWPLVLLLSRRRVHPPRVQPQQTATKLQFCLWVFTCFLFTKIIMFWSRCQDLCRNLRGRSDSELGGGLQQFGACRWEMLCGAGGELPARRWEAGESLVVCPGYPSWSPLSTPQAHAGASLTTARSVTCGAGRNTQERESAQIKEETKKARARTQKGDRGNWERVWSKAQQGGNVNGRAGEEMAGKHLYTELTRG